VNRKLEGRVAWITGAGRGLGRAIALAYAEAGAELFLTARTASELEETAKAAQERGADVDWCTADVRSKAAVEAAYARALERFGRVDVLVNNAGVWIEKPLLEFSDEEWQLTLDTNVNGVYRCTRAVLPAMKARRRGRIINLASIDGQVGFQKLVPQCTSKFAVVGFTRALAKELWADGIAVTALCPAEVDKSVAWGEEPRERPGAPSVKLVAADVARAAVFLASDDAEAITGGTLDVYGIGFLAS
jgi:meso-butanediol dehydrogenase/(S,S)-butanediol dehydrogenase/diacetyl reductase